MSEIHIRRSDIGLLYQHAEEGLPLESVALLFGTLDGEVTAVNRIVCVVNDAYSRTRFAVDPQTQYQLLLEAEQMNEELVGIFHSHPAPLRPSEIDIRFMKLNPVPWLVASKSLGSWEIRAFILKDNRPAEIQIIIQA